MLDYGATPQEARSVLPNSLKTEVVMTANLREWRHVLQLRCADSAHPQMQQLMRPVLAEFKRHLPELFDDIHPALS
jgi:thymidylate synthase (FAD)